MECRSLTLTAVLLVFKIFQQAGCYQEPKKHVRVTLVVVEHYYAAAAGTYTSLIAHLSCRLLQARILRHGRTPALQQTPAAATLSVLCTECVLGNN